MHVRAFRTLRNARRPFVCAHDIACDVMIVPCTQCDSSSMFEIPRNRVLIKAYEMIIFQRKHSYTVRASERDVATIWMWCSLPRKRRIDMLCKKKKRFEYTTNKLALQHFFCTERSNFSSIHSTDHSSERQVFFKFTNHVYVQTYDGKKKKYEERKISKNKKEIK